MVDGRGTSRCQRMHARTHPSNHLAASARRAPSPTLPTLPRSHLGRPPALRAEPPPPRGCSARAPAAHGAPPQGAGPGPLLPPPPLPPRLRWRGWASAAPRRWPAGPAAGRGRAVSSRGSGTSSSASSLQTQQQQQRQQRPPLSPRQDLRDPAGPPRCAPRSATRCHQPSPHSSRCCPAGLTGGGGLNGASCRGGARRRRQAPQPSPWQRCFLAASACVGGCRLGMCRF